MRTMRITPYDIRDKEFKYAFRGYNCAEVNDFLDQITDCMEYMKVQSEQLEKENEDLKQQVQNLQGQLDEVSATGRHTYASDSPQSAGMMEQSIYKSIRVAQEVANEVSANAKKEAEIIVQEANKNADRVLNEAIEKCRAWERMAMSYEVHMKGLIRSHWEMIENSDWCSTGKLAGEADRDVKETASTLPDGSEMDKVAQEAAATKVSGDGATQQQRASTAAPSSTQDSFSPAMDSQQIAGSLPTPRGGGQSTDRNVLTYSPTSTTGSGQQPSPYGPPAGVQGNYSQQVQDGYAGPGEYSSQQESGGYSSDEQPRDMYPLPRSYRMRPESYDTSAGGTASRGGVCPRIPTYCHLPFPTCGG